MRKEKEIKDTQIGRRSKFISSDDMIFYVENPKDTMNFKKMLQLINKYKISIQKSVAFIYIKKQSI